MKIYKNLTFQITDLKQVYLIKEKTITDIINIIYPFHLLIWQGPYFSKTINLMFENSKINFIVESNDDVGMFFSLIEVGIKKISISKSLDKKLIEKILSIAKQSNVKIYFTENFKIEKFNL